jgi:2-haloacid dehalogenase
MRNPTKAASAASIDLTEIETLTFDCYGTLIDWESGIYHALDPVLKHHGIALSRDELLEIHSEIEPQLQRADYRPYRQILNEVTLAFGKRLGFDPTDTETERLANSVGNWPAFPDSAKALRKLQERYKLAIVSNIDNDLIRLSVAQLGIEFDWIVTAQNAKAYKPALAVFHHAFEHMRLKSTQVLHVAQSIFHDIVPANTLRMQTVWVNRRKGLPGAGATPAAVAKPTLEVSSLAELADTLSR